MKRYCLANYILTADIPEDIGFGTQSVTVGGEGSYLDSISVKFNNNLFETTGDNTGSWVHTKNLNSTGTIDVTLNQVSDKVAIFKALNNSYLALDSEASGLTLTLRDNLNNTLLIAEDCLITTIPSQDFGANPGTQTWSFTCGKITFF